MSAQAATSTLSEIDSSPRCLTILATMPRSDEMDAWIRDRRRLDALVGTQLLDTPAEESFDRLTRLAAKLVKVPATFITLVDEQRDFYKSCFGVGESRTFRRELEGRSFCHYTLVSSGPMLINDTLAETIFREVPEVEALGVRAYAGIPLITDSGQALGSFCAVDFVPREWSSLERY
jgi:GAF domain-containing protein